MKRLKRNNVFSTGTRPNVIGAGIGGIAATILVLVGVGYGITNMGEDMRPPTPQDTFSDPEAAYKALQATLIEVSANLNKGIEQIEETRIDVTKVNQEVRKEIQQ